MLKEEEQAYENDQYILIVDSWGKDHFRSVIFSKENGHLKLSQVFFNTERFTEKVIVRMKMLPVNKKLYIQ